MTNEELARHAARMPPEPGVLLPSREEALERCPENRPSLSFGPGPRGNRMRKKRGGWPRKEQAKRCAATRQGRRTGQDSVDRSTLGPAPRFKVHSVAEEVETRPRRDLLMSLRHRAGGTSLAAP